MKSRWWLIAGGILALSAVALGAFGAHGLKSAVQAWGIEPAEQYRVLENWQVGVRYQMYHALGLLVIGTLATVRPSRAYDAAAALLISGTAIFSGCLYLYVLSGVKAFALIVPVGGAGMLGGWLVLVIALARQSPSGERL